MLAFCSSSLIVLAEINKLVSSANNWMFSPGTEFGRSLTYKRNKSGPRTDPWGMPQGTASLLGYMLPIVVIAGRNDQRSKVIPGYWQWRD